jgi:hypothetical protein
LTPHAAVAQCQPARRALVVGINTYSGARPPGVRVEKPLVARLPVQGSVAARPFDNLDGAVNDASDFADLLESKGYDFAKGNVVRLLEEKATAQNILDTFQRHLIDGATCPGDIEVFYYSGHGSQIRNQYVKDETSPDRFDQTLVAYDAAEGVPDIRNKELDRLYLAAARKGVYLTVIADSCQSGGLSRGAGQFAKGKAADPDRRYVADPGPRDASQRALLPTRLSSGVPHAVLLLAASYETEEAREDGDETHPHGAFTAALLKKLQDHGLHEPIGAIFDDVKFEVGLTQASQHPQVYGEGRLDLDLFGGRPDSTTGMVARVKEMRSDGALVLDKGTLAGLYPKCQLVGVSGASGVRLEIREQGAGMTESIAEVTEGSFSGNPRGASFRLDKWVVPDQSPDRLLRPGRPGRGQPGARRRGVERTRILGSHDRLRSHGAPASRERRAPADLVVEWRLETAARTPGSGGGAGKIAGCAALAADRRQCGLGNRAVRQFPLAGEGRRQTRSGRRHRQRRCQGREPTR